jgi:peptidoglycan hydrolase CwlO-like protein
MKNLAILIVLLILAASIFTGCGISKDSYDAAVKEANDLRDQLSDVQADLTTAQDNLSQSDADLAAAQQNLNTVLDDRDLILKQLDETEDDLTAAQDQLESANSLITTLQSQIDELESADSLITTLQSQITTLQSQVDQFQEITDLSLYSTKLDAVTIYQAANVYENIVSFTADYAGYVTVSGTSSTFNTAIRVTDSFTGYPYNEYLHHFGTGTTLKIPVLPGTITVYLSNTNPVGLTATITVTYYY